MPSLEVAWMLLIYSIQFLIQICFTATGRHLSSCWSSVVLLWPCSLTNDLDLKTWRRYCPVEPACQIS